MDIPKGWLYGTIWLIVLAVASALAYYYRPEVEPTPNQTNNDVEASKITTQLLTGGLSAPTAIVSTEANQFLYVAEQAGKIRVVNNDTVIAEPFLDITAKTRFQGEMGLLGLAFHPDIQNDRRVFVNYVNKDRNTVIASFAVNQSLTKADPGSEKTLLTYSQPYTNHNGGELQFGSDGYLYIASGDGGSGGDPQDRAQSLSTLLGKILRIDVNNDSPYAIPSDNPFINTDSAKKEIWAYGLRNPWRFSFDSKTQDLWIADVGQGDWEEINFVSSGTKNGLNFGWRCYEGTNEYNLDGCDKPPYQKPVVEYEHRNGRCSVTGGYVYRGTTYPALDGQYFYGDYCTGEIFSGKVVNGSWAQSLYLDTDYSITTFGLDNTGELYVADADQGTIYKIGVK